MNCGKLHLVRSVTMTLFFCVYITQAKAQKAISQKLIYSAKVIFHGYSLPFKNVKDNFLNLGFGLGVDYPYNRNASLLQSFSVGVLRHKQHGNLYSVGTQFSYRPLLFKALEPGIALGISRTFSFSNRQNPFYSIENGSWQKSGSQHQGHWQIPVGLSLGYRLHAFNQFAVTPYVSYEAAALLRYNSAFPVLPSTSLAAGIRFAHLKK